MSVSLYYEARRKNPITPEEKAVCEEIAKRYDEQYPFGRLYEGFVIYDLEECSDENEKDVIFSGATKLPPTGNERFFYDVGNHWIKCLYEITKALPGAEWNVHVDDVKLRWDDEVRQRFPTDEVWDD